MTLEFSFRDGGTLAHQRDMSNLREEGRRFELGRVEVRIGTCRPGWSSIWPWWRELADRRRGGRLGADVSPGFSAISMRERGRERCARERGGGDVADQAPASSEGGPGAVDRRGHRRSGRGRTCRSAAVQAATAARDCLTQPDHQRISVPRPARCTYAAGPSSATCLISDSDCRRTSAPSTLQATPCQDREGTREHHDGCTAKPDRVDSDRNDDPKREHLHVPPHARSLHASHPPCNEHRGAGLPNPRPRGERSTSRPAP